MLLLALFSFSPNINEMFAALLPDYYCLIYNNRHNQASYQVLLNKNLTVDPPCKCKQGVLDLLAVNEKDDFSLA